jgi:hypothetical protein
VILMAYCGPARRSLIVAGLRDLADFLETHPDLPAPYSVDVTAFVPRAADRVMRAEVDRVASLIGSDIDLEQVLYGHYNTGVNFGAVGYRLIGILAQSRADQAAWSSYHGAVISNALDEEA